MTPTGPAAIVMLRPLGAGTRLAAFVFRGEKGVAWVEPGIWDPYGQRAYRAVKGPVIDHREGFTVKGEWHEVIVAEASAVDLPAAELDLIERGLKADGLTYEQKRAELAALLAPDLAEIGYA
jgi:hypothetical protein